MKPKFILFDFDGVIVDSFAPAFEVKKMICPNTTETSYRKCFEGNINDWLQTDVEHDERCRHDIDFFTEYIPKMKDQVSVVPGMEAIIKELSKSHTLIIISSTLTTPIKELLDKNNLSTAFVEVMGNDVHKSKVEKIKMVFSKYNTDSSSCIFITDTLGDIREAEQTGVSAIGVNWGFHKEETLTQGKPLKIVESPTDLFDTIEYFFSK